MSNSDALALHHAGPVRPHQAVRLERVPHSHHYSCHNHSVAFRCPECGHVRRQNLNFLGQRELVCTGTHVRALTHQAAADAVGYYLMDNRGWLYTRAGHLQDWSPDESDAALYHDRPFAESLARSEGATLLPRE